MKDKMTMETVTEKDRLLAQRCMECPACKRARDKQKGVVFWIVKAVEGFFCPYCVAYEKVYGRKAHEPLPPE
jgi:hypothetical protein